MTLTWFPRVPQWRWLAALIVPLALLSGCAPPVAATQATFSTPVPPAALATIPPPKPQAPTNAGGPNVSIENFNFISASLTVTAGTTVVWTNNDDVQHTVTASDNSFSSQALDTNGQFTYTFNTPGTYSYFCAIHPFMTARVIVQ